MKPQKLNSLRSLGDSVYKDINESLAGKNHAFTYGPFTLIAAITNLGINDCKLTERAIKLCNKLTIDKNYPWEFIHWSIIEGHLNSSLFKKFDKRSFKNTRVLNWRLLKIFVKSITSSKIMKIYQKYLLKYYLLVYVNSNGFIHDRLLTYSHQYHIFSCFLLCRIRETTGFSFLDSYIDRAFCYIYQNKLGPDFYIWRGRGQEQIFGYAALLYVSDYVGGKEGDKCFNRVVRKLRKYYKKKTFLPLVINNNNELHQVNPVGWYGYNNYIDYKSVLLLIVSLLIKKHENSNEQTN